MVVEAKGNNPVKVTLHSAFRECPILISYVQHLLSYVQAK